MEVKMEKYINRSKIEILKSKEYALSFFASLLYIPISVLIPYFLWKYIFQYQETLGQMNLQDVLFYLITIQIVKLSFSDLMAEVYYIFQDINTGQLDLYITKPVNYLLSRYFSALGRIAITFPLGLVFWIIMGGLFNALTLENLIYFTISLFLGFTVFFVVLAIIGTSTFWLKSVLTLRDIFWFILAIFSGEILPLKLFGKSLSFIEHNPLASIYYIPSIIVQETNKAYLILEQGIYLLVFVALLYFLWKVGIGKYESQGG